MPFVPTTDLQDDRGDGLRAFEKDDVGQMLQGPLALLLLGLGVEGTAVRVRAEEVHHPAIGGGVAGPAPRLPVIAIAVAVAPW